MSTRFYLRASATTPVSPAFDANWESTTSAVRRRMTPSTLAGDTLTTDAGKSSTAGQDRLHRQYVSDQMSAGIVFDTSVTYKAYLQALESAADDNILSRMGVRIVSLDGTTVRHTILAVADYSTGAEWNTALRNKAFANGDAGAGSYTTVLGDRLVVEFGHSDSAGTTISGQTRYGSEATGVTDLGEDESSTSTTQRPWFQTSLNIVFAADVLQATETDTAGAITMVPRRLAGQAYEQDRAKQLVVVGGIVPVSEFPVLIRAPLRAGRIFHEIHYKGDTYHPNIAGFQSEETAPGGFGPASGRISERIFRAHRDVFKPGAGWTVWHEDGTCLHHGTLLEPDTSDGEVQLTDRGTSSLADRQVGPILYQGAVGSELIHVSGANDGRWTATITSFAGILSGQSGDTGVTWARRAVSGAQPDPGDVDNGPEAAIPMLGRELAFLRAHVQGFYGQLWIYSTKFSKIPRDVSSAELNYTDEALNYVLRFNPTTAVESAEIEVDLTLTVDETPFSMSGALTNVDDPSGTGFIYPDYVHITVFNDFEADTDVGTEVFLRNIEINGVPVGERRRFSAHDLVADISAVLGIRMTQLEGGGFDILPYELPAGAPAAEALDYASLVSGKQWRLRHNGTRAMMEFGVENRWSLASPWSPFDAIPQERFDAVAVPFTYPGTSLDDQVIVRVDNSPLDRQNVYWGLALSDAAHNGDKARALGAHIAEQLVRKRNAGSFAAAELIDDDGNKTTAHHCFAGDSLQPMRRHEPGRLRISHLTRFEDHIEGDFDGEMHVLDRMLARREKRISRRNA